jgi:hypothetical protein
MRTKKYTVRRSIRNALLWLLLLVAIPLVWGMVLEAVDMIEQGTTTPTRPPSIGRVVPQGER